MAPSSFATAEPKAALLPCPTCRGPVGFEDTNSIFIFLPKPIFGNST